MVYKTHLVYRLLTFALHMRHAPVVMLVYTAIFLCPLRAHAAHRIELPDTLVAADAQVHTLMDTLHFAEGPAVSPDSVLYFTEMNRRRIWNYRHGHVPGVFLDSARGANGLTFDSNGLLYACAGHALLRIDPPTRTIDTLVDTQEDEPAGTCNDLCCTPEGHFFFTKPDFSTNSGHVYHYSAYTGVQRILSDLACPNGIAYWPADSFLYVNVSKQDVVLRYRVSSHGTVDSEADTIARYDEPDGLALDTYGNVYIASYNDATVYVVSPAGHEIGSIAIEDQSVTNCCFDRGNPARLYITGKTGLYMVQCSIAGYAGASGAHIKQMPRPSYTPSYASAAAHTMCGLSYRNRKMHRNDAMLLRANGRMLFNHNNTFTPAAGVYIHLPRSSAYGTTQ
jgi:gluconolactonase